MAFAHLHVHTEYSLLDGSNKIKEYVARVKELGMTAAAITDHGAMFGVIEFYRAARAEGIHPVLGCEVYVAPGSRYEKESSSGEDRYYHLVLLAENQTGYQNLMKLVSKGYVEGFYYKPRVDKEILQEYHEGLIALSACLAGEVQHLLIKDNYEGAKKKALEYREIFGEGNYYLELQDHGIPEQKKVNEMLVKMSRELSLPLVATNDVHYTYREDEKPHDILLCLQTGKKLADEDRMRYVGGQYYVKSEEEMRELFSYAPEALENTQSIAERCQVEIEFGVTKLPKYDVPKPYTSWEYLNKLCYEGLARRYPDETPKRSGELKEKLSYELETIQTMGYVDYFFIVWDFINYARSKGIPVGPGRGSAAGSMVSYCLGITDIDPIRYQLLFERFLNPERVSMPDIDVDFCYERRQEVIDYVVEKYGKDRVVQIVTFGTLAARGVIRDVGRVMDLPYARVDSIAKMIPTDLGITIDKALKQNPELSNLYETDLEVRELIDMSRRLEGLPRHTSMHAAGVVISQTSVDEYVPLSLASDGTIVTQFTMTTLEELGLLKMDFLGLRTLTVIDKAIRMIQESQHKKIEINQIDYDDKKVLESLGTGKSEGVFQLESAGMRSFMTELKPQSLEDVIAGISLYRPGPMDFIPAYIKGKNHPEEIHYDCPELEPILSPTYGCIVYQEQVMQIVRSLAGYTLGRSDLVRRAMSKKKAAVMETERQNFIYGNKKEGVPGCISRGISEEVAKKIYGEMIDFAKYAFNKSHAAAYAVVSYQTAWLKYYYPVEFMAALMTTVIDNTGKTAEYILVARKMGISILPPDINEGGIGFAVSGDSIRYALSAIKNVGRPQIEAIVKERKAGGPFESMQDLFERMPPHVLNKRSIENFIKAGAFDSLEGTRKQQMFMYPRILDQAEQSKKNAMTGQMSLFDFMQPEEKKAYSVKLPPIGEYPREQMLAFEKEVLGIYVSGHPLEEYEEYWRKNVSYCTTDFYYEEERKGSRVKDGERVVVGGIITEKKTKFTKKNEIMAFLVLEDLVGTVEVVVFPRNYLVYKAELMEEAKVFISGRADVGEEQNGKVLLETVVPFGQTKKELWIQFPDKAEYQKKEALLFEELKFSDGNDSVVIYIKNPRAIKRLPPAKNVAVTEELVDKLRAEYGENNVKVVEKGIENHKKML